MLPYCCYTLQSEVWIQHPRQGKIEFQLASALAKISRRVSSVAQVSLQVHRSRREPVAPPYSLPFDSPFVHDLKNYFVSAIASMSGQEDILDGLEVNLQRPSSNFPVSAAHLTPHRRSACRATPKHSNRYSRSHPHKNTTDRK